MGKGTYQTCLPEKVMEGVAGDGKRPVESLSLHLCLFSDEIKVVSPLTLKAKEFPATFHCKKGRTFSWLLCDQGVQDTLEIITFCYLK